MPARIFLGLGSNQNQPAAQLAKALAWCEQHVEIQPRQLSPIYQSPALCLPGQDAQALPDYLNAVLEIESSLSPTELLLAIKAQEQRQGRDLNAPRWSSRPIDIDILLYGDLQLSSDSLCLPHPGIKARDFVLLPWADISPNTLIPELGTVADCAAALGPCTARRIAESLEAL